MASLSSELRNKLERTCIVARNLSEKAARAALEAVAVQHPDAYGHMTREQKDLRNKLRARGRQLGDIQDAKGNLALGHLVQECAYEHWHRMLFARFLAENSLLIPPELGTPVTLNECKELAKEAKTNLWALAGQYAQTMLPEIFRTDDPVLQVPLAREDQLKLEAMLNDLPEEVFTANDSLGWCYQFWQTQRKQEVNDSEVKIGANELPSVTQLFTEDYMVNFILDNTLGAWWCGKKLSVINKQLSAAKTEDECQKLIALPGCLWKYLRFVKDEKTGWRPAARSFEGWPKTAKELKCLDPCMGSGHFVVAMFERLVAIRIADERLSEKDAIATVIHNNLFGLEIDPRCTQIAAFNLALAAWRRIGHCPLPPMNLACSGLAPHAKKEEWLKLAGKNEKLQRGMARLHQLFQKAPILGSLINPSTDEGDLLVAAFHELQPLLRTALAHETSDDMEHELVVTAYGLSKTAEILADKFTLIATNVPYLGREKQDDELQKFADLYYSDSIRCLSTIFLSRSLQWCTHGSTIALVTPQNWLFQARYVKLRETLLTNTQWNLTARLGEHAFESPAAAGAFAAITVLSAHAPSSMHQFTAYDVSAQRGEPPIRAEAKAELLRGEKTAKATTLSQHEQFLNPDHVIRFDVAAPHELLSQCGRAWQGMVTGDDNRYVASFWEFSSITDNWRGLQQAPASTHPYTGRSDLIRWEKEEGDLHNASSAHNFPPKSVLGETGIAIQRVSQICATLYTGEVFDDSVAPFIPKRIEDLPAIWAFCESPDFRPAVRSVNQSLKVVPGSINMVKFDLSYWQKVAAKKYPHGLPKPFSNDPTQWLFNGHPKGADHPVHVALARLLGYEWPLQTGSSFPDCPRIDDDGLTHLADSDGIVCIPSVRGEEPAADRLRKLLTTAYGKEWKPTSERDLIRAAGSESDDFDGWLRDDFFEQHCYLFHQRPFLWHIWDGRKRDGFHVIINYHKLAGDKGRKLLESLTHSYLGEWITRQKHGIDPKHPEDGAEERLAAALELKKRLEAIIEGDAPNDIFVRWKPLSEQAIGWEPDINAGVRMNIRPFLASDIPGGKKGAGILRVKPNIKWDKDRGKEPQRDKKEFPWFWTAGKFTGERVNDVHLTNEEKQKARKELGEKQ